MRLVNDQKESLFTLGSLCNIKKREIYISIPVVVLFFHFESDKNSSCKSRGLHRGLLLVKIYLPPLHSYMYHSPLVPEDTCGETNYDEIQYMWKRRSNNSCDAPNKCDALCPFIDKWKIWSSFWSSITRISN